MSEVVLVFVLSTFITALIAVIFDKRVDDAYKRFEDRIREIERKLEELRKEIEKLREEDKLFDWAKML